MLIELLVFVRGCLVGPTSALSFCNFQELPLLKAIEKLTRNALTPLSDHPGHAPTIGNLHLGVPAVTRAIPQRTLGSRNRMIRRGPRKRSI